MELFLKGVVEIRRKVIGSLIILALVWTGNIVYFLRQQLAEPIFMNHYYDFYLYEASQNFTFDLYYLVNKSQNQEIVGIEIPDLNLSLNTTNIERDRFTHQVLKQLRVELNEEALKTILDSGKDSFQQVEARFNDGSKQVMNIGSVQFHKAKLFETKALAEKSSGSSNSDAGYRMLLAEERVEISGFDYSFKELLADAIRVSIDTSQSRLEEAHREAYGTDIPDASDARKSLFDNTGTDLNQIKFPITMNQGDFLKVNYQFAFDDTEETPEHRGQRDAYYRLSGQLSYKTQDGQEFGKTFDLHYTPYFTDRDIKGIILERRGE